MFHFSLCFACPLNFFLVYPEIFHKIFWINLPKMFDVPMKYEFHMRQYWETFMKKGLIGFLLNLRSWKTSQKAGKNIINFCQNSFIYARLLSFLLLQIDSLIHFRPMFMVRKEVPPPLPLFRHPLLDPACPLFLKFLCPLFTVPPPFKVF